jgi:hypothetical protein
LIFIQILRTFYNYTLDILPFFAAAILIAAVALEYFPARTLDTLIKKNEKREVLISVFFGILFPATPASRVPMAALARRGGASWTPVLSFIGAGAGAGTATILMTVLVGWRIALLRLVMALLFALVLSLIITRFVEPRFAAAAMDAEVAPLCSREFCEIAAGELDGEDEPTIGGAWCNIVQLVRITAPWLFLSIAIATLINVLMPSSTVQGLFAGNLSAVKASLVGLPFYLAGGADIPLLLVFLDKGMTLGAAVSFMLAAPLINFPVIITMKRWLGYRKTIAFLAICWVVASLIGSVLVVSGL